MLKSINNLNIIKTYLYLKCQLNLVKKIKFIISKMEILG